MQTLREKIQNQFIDILIQNNCIGTIGGGMGIGKSYCAIEIIKRKHFRNILITGYRTPLKENWEKELKKWGFWKLIEITTGVPTGKWIGEGLEYYIQITNIQTCYRWTKETLQQFDLVILDKNLFN
ncbi:MAG: hypothetical protein EHM93_19775 [Bacteroidales bacterium]|nr:MAG: hypothetical protein EHM93_19775 [Bacteroidales bacterium]